MKSIVNCSKNSSINSAWEPSLSFFINLSRLYSSISSKYYINFYSPRSDNKFTRTLLRYSLFFQLFQQFIMKFYEEFYGESMNSSRYPHQIILRTHVSLVFRNSSWMFSKYSPKKNSGKLSWHFPGEVLGSMAGNQWLKKKSWKNFKFFKMLQCLMG